ncbi:MAG: PAS domain S-box protein [Thermodesulfobacteriota bacterium]
MTKPFCWKRMDCKEISCPVFGTENLKCWTITGTRCRGCTQGSLSEKIIICIECDHFKESVDRSSFEEALRIINDQFIHYRKMVQKRDEELENFCGQQSRGVSEVLEALKKIASGDPAVRISEDSPIETIAALKQMVNTTAENIAEIVDFSHEFAMSLAEHFDVLHRVMEGDLNARVGGGSGIELLSSLKELTNSAIDSISKEISTRIRVEEAIRQSELKYRQLYEGSRDGYAATDLSGKIVESNSSFREMLGYDASELSGLNYLDLTPETWHSLEKEILQNQVLKRGYSEIYEKEYRKKDGTVFPVEIRTYLLEENGKPRGTWSFIRDVSERKRLEAEFFQAQKMEAIGRLTGGIAHDFNNLLTAIIGRSDLLLMKYDEKDSFYSEIEEIKKAGQRAASLTRQLLAFSRKQIFQMKIVNLNFLISDMEKMLKPIVGEDIELLTLLDPDLGRIEADPVKIEQVIMNLLVNSRDAMPRGGKISIKTKNLFLEDSFFRGHDIRPRPGAYVMVSISDTGTGIPPETLPYIFEPFFTTKEKEKGTGLGLSTVYGIVRQSGGHIFPFSIPGKGTTFRIYLPRINSAAEDHQQYKTDPAGLRGSETILLVEDDLMVRNLSRNILEKYGYRVLEASGESQAQAICSDFKETIHMLLTDIVLPESNGIEIAGKVKSARPSIKILFMSGYAPESVLRFGIHDPARELIEKPFSLEGLLRKVRERLDTP